MLRLLAVPIAVLALVAAGCGAQTSSAGDFEGAEADVAQVVEDLQTAMGEDEPKTVCDDLLTDKAKGSASNCENAVTEARDHTDTFELAVDSVRVSGTTARARVDVGGDDDRTELMTFVKEGDVWKIDSLGQPVED